jgi:3-(methylthio)propanoyl-CoA dehydrogenase
MTAIRRHGSDEQRATYVTEARVRRVDRHHEPHRAAGRLRPGRAHEGDPRGRHYRIKGTKIYITWGEHDMTENIVHLVLARTPDAPEGVKGISLFIVPKFLVNADGSLGARNDVKCVSIEHKLGIHGSPTCVMAYGDDGRRDRLPRRRGEPRPRIHVHDDELRPPRSGRGGRCHRRARVPARPRVREAAGAGPRDRREGRRPRPIIHHPDVRRMLMTMKARVEAMRALAAAAAEALDHALSSNDPEAKRRGQAVFDLLTRW